MIDCRDLTFSSELSKKRIAQAQKIFGTRVIKYILCFALYLLGVSRKAIANATDISPETLKTLLRKLYKEGLSAFEDRRQSSASFLPLPAPVKIHEVTEISLYKQDQSLVVDFGIQDRKLTIPRGNTLQVRTVLLTMLNSQFLSKEKVASFLELTIVHTGNLARKLHNEDVSALVEKRQGQQQDYRVGPEVKAELIQQFAVNVVSQGRTSGKQIAENLRERCNLEVPERTVRHHVAKLGLPIIKESLPKMLVEVKKNCKQQS